MFEPLLYVPTFTEKDFHYIVHIGLPTQGTSTEDLDNTNQEYTTPLSNKHNLYISGKAQQQSPLHLEGWTLSQTTITSHQRDKALSQTTITSHQRDKALQPTLQQSPLHLEGYQPNQTPSQSPLHKRDKAQSYTPITITSTLRGIPTKPNSFTITSTKRDTYNSK